MLNLMQYASDSVHTRFNHLELVWACGIAPSMWQAVYGALDQQAKLIRTPTGSWLPRNAQLLEVGSIKKSPLKRPGMIKP